MKGWQPSHFQMQLDSMRAEAMTALARGNREKATRYLYMIMGAKAVQPFGSPNDLAAKRVRDEVTAALYPDETPVA